MTVLDQTGYDLFTIKRAMDARFAPVFAAGGLPTWFMQVAMPNLESDQAEETYAWLGSAPMMQQFSGPIPTTKLTSEKYAIENLPFGVGIEIPYDKLRQQGFGAFQRQVTQMAQRAQLWPLRQLYTEMLASSVGYDGKALFADDHPMGASTKDNNITSSATAPTAPTAAEIVTAVMAAIANIRANTDDQGEPIAEDLNTFKVFVPPTFLRAAHEAFGAPVIASGSTAVSNVIVMGGTGMNITFECSPRLASWTTKIAVFASGLGMAPYIYQQEKPVGTDVIDDQKNRQVIYTVDASGNVKPGYWQLSCLVTLS